MNKELVSNADNGKTLYVQHCASCHQLDGQGLY
ncbi:MAG: cytochrome c, partial [Pseudoalteromonas tetraodonis]|nr:cytochrome c [Pseudoalteromonas tetraodonis]